MRGGGVLVSALTHYTLVWFKRKCLYNYYYIIHAISPLLCPDFAGGGSDKVKLGREAAL